MNVEQGTWVSDEGWLEPPKGALGQQAQLVLAFGGARLLSALDPCEELRRLYPSARIVGCSTAGEISGNAVFDESLAVTAIQFEKSRVHAAQIDLRIGETTRASAARLARELPQDDLRHVFVLSDGIEVNGSALVAGLRDVLPETVSITGGLSGDGPKFMSTRVFLDGPPREGVIAAVGFYGKDLAVSFGSQGGWSPFGPDRLITRSEGNVLYELSGQSALDLYKRYLADHARDLPASALLFPLEVRVDLNSPGVVRTILSVDEREHSLIFAGDVPQGAYARLMLANPNRLLDGAAQAARVSQLDGACAHPDLAILVSCVGRKFVLKQRTDEEVEAVRETFGPRTAITGFYAYGEISPHKPGDKCGLHNQTMSITTFSES